jgi:uncharacterized protein (DUF1501 family)
LAHTLAQDAQVVVAVQGVRQAVRSDRILLVVTGEMGRSPRLNQGGGRDHHGGLTPLLLAGGGLKTGQVIGRSDATASRPATTGYTPANLFATVRRFLFDVGNLRLRSDVNRDIKAALENTPAIEELC